MSQLDSESRVRFFGSRRSAQSFIVGIDIFFASWGLGVVTIVTGWTWLLVLVVPGSVVGGAMALLTLRFWTLGLRDRHALVRQLGDASITAEWSSRLVASVTLGLLVLDVVSFSAVWLLGVALR